MISIKTKFIYFSHLFWYFVLLCGKRHSFQSLFAFFSIARGGEWRKKSWAIRMKSKKIEKKGWWRCATGGEDNERTRNIK